MVRVVVLGAGYVASHLAVGLERIRKGLVKPYGVPLAKYDLPYRVEDVRVVAAYDIDLAKIGRTLYDVAKEVFGAEYPVPEGLKSIEVREGIKLNSDKGLNIKARGLEEELGLKGAVERLVNEWVELRPEVVINIISTEEARAFNDPEALRKAIEGSGEGVSASHAYAYAAYLYAKKAGRGVAFVNAIPTPIANDPAIVKLFEEANSVVFGDDGATGATPLTADLLEHLAERNRYVEFIVQFNIGGNTDFLALTVPERNKMKEFTKSSIVKDILGYDAPHYIKPTGYLEPLGDKKFVAMHIEYLSFNGFRDSIFINARINDSPALAGMLVDLARLGKAVLERGVKGTLYEVNAFFMKKPGPANAKNVSKVLAYARLLKWLGIKDPIASRADF